MDPTSSNPGSRLTGTDERLRWIASLPADLCQSYREVHALTGHSEEVTFAHYDLHERLVDEAFERCSEGDLVNARYHCDFILEEERLDDYHGACCLAMLSTLPDLATYYADSAHECFAAKVAERLDGVEASDALLTFFSQADWGLNGNAVRQQHDMMLGIARVLQQEEAEQRAQEARKAKIREKKKAGKARKRVVQPRTQPPTQEHSEHSDSGPSDSQPAEAGLTSPRVNTAIDNSQQEANTPGETDSQASATTVTVEKGVHSPEASPPLIAQFARLSLNARDDTESETSEQQFYSACESITTESEILEQQASTPTAEVSMNSASSERSSSHGTVRAINCTSPKSDSDMREEARCISPKSNSDPRAERAEPNMPGAQSYIFGNSSQPASDKAESPIMDWLNSHPVEASLVEKVVGDPWLVEDDSLPSVGTFPIVTDVDDGSELPDPSLFDLDENGDVRCTVKDTFDDTPDENDKESMLQKAALTGLASKSDDDQAMLPLRTHIPNATYDEEDDKPSPVTESDDDEDEEKDAMYNPEFIKIAWEKVLWYDAQPKTANIPGLELNGKHRLFCQIVVFLRELRKCWQGQNCDDFMSDFTGMNKAVFNERVNAMLELEKKRNEEYEQQRAYQRAWDEMAGDDEEKGKALDAALDKLLRERLEKDRMEMAKTQEIARLQQELEEHKRNFRKALKLRDGQEQNVKGNLAHVMEAISHPPMKADAPLSTAEGMQMKVAAGKAQTAQELKTSQATAPDKLLSERNKNAPNTAATKEDKDKALDAALGKLQNDMDEEDRKAMIAQKQNEGLDAALDEPSTNPRLMSEEEKIMAKGMADIGRALDAALDKLQNDMDEQDREAMTAQKQNEALDAALDKQLTNPRLLSEEEIIAKGMADIGLHLDVADHSNKTVGLTDEQQKRLKTAYPTEYPKEVQNFRNRLFKWLPTGSRLHDELPHNLKLSFLKWDTHRRRGRQQMIEDGLHEHVLAGYRKLGKAMDSQVFVNLLVTLFGPRRAVADAVPEENQNHSWLQHIEPGRLTAEEMDKLKAVAPTVFTKARKEFRNNLFTGIPTGSEAHDELPRSIKNAFLQWDCNQQERVLHQSMHVSTRTTFEALALIMAGKIMKDVVETVLGPEIADKAMRPPALESNPRAAQVLISRLVKQIHSS